MSQNNVDSNKKYSRRKALKTGASAFLATGSLGALASQRASASHTTKLTISVSSEYTVQIDGTIESTAKFEDEDSVTDKGSYYEITGGPDYADEDIVWFSGNIKKVQITGTEPSGKFYFEGEEQYSSQDSITVDSSGTGEDGYTFSVADSVSATENCETGTFGNDGVDNDYVNGTVYDQTDTWDKSGSIRGVSFNCNDSSTITLTHY